MFDPQTVKDAVEQWLKFYKRSPVLTLTMTVIVTLIISVGIYLFERGDVKRREQIRLKNFSYQNQISHLTEMKSNIYDLLEFVEHQKTSLQEHQDLIDSLRIEKDKLKPIVDADRKIVDAIFEAQEEKKENEIVTQRWVGFGLGVVSSLIASIIWQIFNLLFIKFKKSSD